MTKNQQANPLKLDSAKKENSSNNNMSIKIRRIRASARKIRIVADLVRNKPINESLVILNNINKKGALIVKKAINSAVANAVNNGGADIKKLYIKTIMINEGSTLKRHQPRARGAAYEILKRTCHIYLNLGLRGK